MAKTDAKLALAANRELQPFSRGRNAARQMLGVRRATVNKAAGPLQQRKLIASSAAGSGSSIEQASKRRLPLLCEDRGQCTVASHLVSSARACFMPMR